MQPDINSDYYAPLQPEVNKTSAPVLNKGLSSRAIITIISLMVVVAALTATITYSIASNNKNTNSTTQTAITTTIPVTTTAVITSALPSTVAPTQTPTTTIETVNGNNKYINYDLGISVTFPNTASNYPTILNNTNCVIDPNSVNKTGPLNLFDNSDNNFLYLSFDKFIQYHQKHTSTGEVTPLCELKPTTTSILYKGYNAYDLYPSGAPKNIDQYTRFPDFAERIIVGKINSDQDFATLMNKALSNLNLGLNVSDCTFVSKTLEPNSTDIYDVKLGTNSSDANAGSCPSGYYSVSKTTPAYYYTFRYSSKYKTAFALVHEQSPLTFTYNVEFL